MASKPSRSIFSGIFSRKERKKDSSPIDPIAEKEVLGEVLSDQHEMDPEIQPPRLQRLNKSWAAQIESYRESLKIVAISEPESLSTPLEPLERLEPLEVISEDIRMEEDDRAAIVPSSRSKRHRSKRDRRKAHRKSKKKTRRDQSPSQPLGQRLRKGMKGAGKTALRGAGRGAKWTVTAMGRQSKALFNFVYPPFSGYVSRHRWSFISAGIISLTVGTGTAAVWWLSKVPPVADCGKILDWSPDNQRLYCLQLEAQTGNVDAILRGMDLVKHWPTSHPLYGQGSQAMAQWTEELMVLARDRFNKQDLDGAIALAQKVPPTSPIYKETRDEIDRWQEARNLGQKIYGKIQTALQKQYWQEASGLLAKLSTVIDPSWQRRLTEIRQQVEAEKTGAAVFKQAQTFAQLNPPEDLGRAIALTDPINRKTYVWQAALKNVDQWRNQVFDLAIVQLLQKNNVTTANTLITSIPANITLTPEQSNFVNLVQATHVIKGKDIGVPLLQQIGYLAFADQLLAQIPQDSRFNKEAAALKPKLDQSSEDAVKMAAARTLANMGTLPLLQSAIVQAEQIDLNRPSRLQAQTYIAQWRKEVERLEDRPLISQATQLAQKGTISQYNEAAALMGQIVKGRALYPEAQQQKNRWIAQAQTLEDQPILSQANAQANSGQLSQAIQTARKIRVNRALYAEAQRSIGGWADQLQAISDRATMERATALADRGNLTQAIDAASSVSSNAVYSEARSAIAQWYSEREKIRQARELAPRDNPPSTPSENRDVAPSREDQPVLPQEPTTPSPSSTEPSMDPLPPTKSSP